jgi:hypothetical protein
MHGGNLLQAALIAGISMAIGVGVGNAIAANVPAAYQGVVNVIASGMVGGAISSAMGGDFWQGFTSAAVAAGVNLAANEVAGEIEASNDADSQQSGSSGAGSQGGFSGASSSGDPVQVDPIKDLPNADTLPVGQRNAIIVEGADWAGHTDIHAGAEQAASELTDKGYHVIRPSKPLTSEAQARAFLKANSPEGQTVIVRVHHWLVPGNSSADNFQWKGQARTVDSKMVAMVAGARRVVFLGCNTHIPAALFASLYGASAWGTTGNLWTSAPKTPDPIYGYVATFWQYGSARWY